jgi:hypothetical protein
VVGVENEVMMVWTCKISAWEVLNSRQTPFHREFGNLTTNAIIPSPKENPSKPIVVGLYPQD